MRSHSRWRGGPLLLATLLTSVLLLGSACGRTVAQSPTQSHLATPTLPPFPTPLPTQPPAPTVTVLKSSGDPVWGKTASWARANLPAGFGMQFHVSDVEVAPSNGKIAYACGPGYQSAPANPPVVVTHDGGVSWVAVANIPVHWGSCSLLAVDLLDPSVVIATADFGGPQEITYDGGKSWQALPLPSGQWVELFATYGGRMYALVNVPSSDGNSSKTVFFESSDHMRTEREIDGVLSNANLRQFWINPGNGALMLQTFDTGLWTSEDDGANWTQIEIPTVSVVDFMVQQPAANAPWQFCGEYYASQNDSTGSLICSWDGGASWFEPPAVTFRGLAGFAGDGALLVFDDNFMVYRLPPRATRWQKLGVSSSPGSYIVYFVSDNGGMFWKFPAESDGGPISDKPNDISSAVYPY